MTATDRPRAVLRWLSVPLIADALEQIVTGRLTVTHAGIDTLGATLSVDKLRAVLVSAGLLAARDEQLARLEMWVAARLAGIDDPKTGEPWRRSPCGGCYAGCVTGPGAGRR